MSVAVSDDSCMHAGSSEKKERKTRDKNDVLTAQELGFHIRQCCLNNRESQKRIYESFYGYTITICQRYTNNYDDSLEILNDGFLKIFKKINGYRPAFSDEVSSFKGWIRKIMMYTAVDHFRRNQRRAKTIQVSDEAVGRSEDGENAIDRISYREIAHFIQRVTPGYRMVLNLYAIEGFTHEEISKHLGISIGTSKSNLAKGRRQLKKILFPERT